MAFRGVCDCKSLLWHNTHEGHPQDGELASWSCLQHKQLGEKRGNLVIAQGEAGSRLSCKRARQCLAQLKPLSGIRHQQIVLAVSQEPNPAVEEEVATAKDKHYQQASVPDRNIIQRYFLSLRIPNLQVTKGLELFRINSQKKNRLSYLSFGSTVYQRMKSRQQVLSVIKICSRIRTTPPTITCGSQHIFLFSWIFPWAYAQSKTLGLEQKPPWERPDPQPQFRNG